MGCDGSKQEREFIEVKLENEFEKTNDNALVKF